MVAHKEDLEIMSEFGGGEELLEEIVETTEEHEADICRLVLHPRDFFVHFSLLFRSL